MFRINSLEYIDSCMLAGMENCCRMEPTERGVEACWYCMEKSKLEPLKVNSYTEEVRKSPI